MSDYLTLVEALAIHDDQIERYGGLSGVRDHGILEAALYRPQTGYYANPVEEAAALWESLAQNHPFIDGNKRTAFAATYTFLAINGTNITADAFRKFPRLTAGECCATQQKDAVSRLSGLSVRRIGSCSKGVLLFRQQSALTWDAGAH